MHLGKRQEANSSSGNKRREVLPLGREAELAEGEEGAEKGLCGATRDMPWLLDP